MRINVRGVRKWKFLESRRLAALVLAYLRGVLKPDYPNGLKSIIRENLIIAAIEREEMSETFSKQLLFFSPLLTMQDQGSYDKFVKNMQNRFIAANNMKFFSSEITDTTVNDVDQLVNMYNLLEKLNIIK